MLGFSGSSPLTLSTLSSARYRSHSFGGRTWPETVSPVRRSKRLICGRDVDVVGAVQVVPVLAAQKAVAFGQNFEHAFAADDGVRSSSFCSIRKIRSCLRSPE